MEVVVRGDTSTLAWRVYNNSAVVVWARYFADDTRIEFASHKDARAFIVEMGRVYGVAPVDRVFTHY